MILLNRRFGYFLALVLLASVVLAPRLASAETKAQQSTQFPKKKIKLAGKTLLVEIADNDSRRSQGLMYREKLNPGEGMLFIFDQESIRSFWMMNTLIPLAIGYFDRNRKLLEVVEMVPAIAGDKSPPVYPSKQPAKYALEMPKGWFAQNNVKPGATFAFVEKP